MNNDKQGHVVRTPFVFIGNNENLLHIDHGHVAVERFEWQPSGAVFTVADATRFERGSNGWAAVTP